MDVVLPWLYLKGISTGQMADALSVFIGANAKMILFAGHQPCQGAVVRRIRPLASPPSRRGYQGVNMGEGGIYAKPRGDEHKLCILVLIASTNGARRRFSPLRTVFASRHRAGGKYSSAARDGA